MLQAELFPCQRQKNIVKYSVLALGKRPKKQQTIAKKCPKWTSKKRLGILSSFSSPWTPKNVKAPPV
jgi:hypothetical protein